METNLCERLKSLIEALSAGLVERRPQVRLALLAALAGEHTLLIGPPGTAKSELARRLHTAFRDARYFERLLTRFTVPEELFGPLSIRALEEDRYERHTAGFLPAAGIAFIDEVFKANSAILNALLTLLNEREFDNGAGRQGCPLISAIGATNAVPEDEVADAFFDRFLLRVPVVAVSDGGFDELLNVILGAGGTAPDELALHQDDLDALAETARRVELPAPFAALLAELRRACAEMQIAVSDRRWVKIVWLLRIAAASVGRSQVSLWDLLLLPWGTAPDTERQALVADWLAARLGVREAFSPARLTRIVEAFEAQLDLEQKANDLDYDESGRLKFSANDLADNIGDAKGGAPALRMTYTRQRRYGALHIASRTTQIDDALARIAGYAAEVAAQRADLAAYRACNLWLDEALLARIDAHLASTAAAVDQLAARLSEARAGFEALPRLAADDGRVPEPVAVESLEAA
ncbi:MAG: AAA family ATPase [Pseudomonadota bacterium]